MESSTLLRGLFAVLHLLPKDLVQRQMPMAKPGAYKKLDVAACSQRWKS